MIQWKQRLYAFLLRRILGPFLDESETKKLHDSVDFSLNEGKYVLKDISLNAKYLTEKLAVSAPGLSIRKATIERLEINLTLRENSHDETAQTDAAAQSSLAWRAMKLGTTNASLPAVSLVAEIKVHGVDLELEPCECKRRPPTTPEPVAVEDTNAEFSSKSVIGSYVNAALASLQLSLKLTKINIKLCHKNGEKETWVALRLSSVSYKDLDVAGNNISNSSGSKIVLNKSIDFSEITIQAGELYLGNDEVCRKLSSRQSTVALAKGTGNIYVRLIQYLKDQKQGPTEDNLHLQQDIEVNMNHQMNLSVDKTSIVYLRDIADGFANISETDLEEDEFLEPVSVPFACNPHFAMDEATDQEDLKAITGIMKQYREAYHLAEQNQLRGGILVPTNAYLEVGETHKEEDDTFDVFFDANDQSFYHAASVLAESVRMLDDRPTDDDEHIHTNFKMHLLSGCFKIVFREPDGHLPKPDEYVLMTLDEMNLFMSSSHRTSQLSLNIAHFEVEDAQLDKTKTTPSCFSVGDSQAYEGTVEIGSLLGFISESNSGDEFEHELVVSQAPSISLNIKTTKDNATTSSLQCDVTLLPIEIFFRQRTISNLSTFAAHLKEEPAKPESTKLNSIQNDDLDDKASKQISFCCHCPSVTFSIPLLKEVTTGPLFDRCGEVLENARITGASVGVLIDNTSFEWTETKNDEIDSNELESSGNFSCHHLLFFAKSPIGDKITVDTKMQRTDICVARGRMEVNPYIPISIDFRKNSPGRKEGNHGRHSFPLVPAISSFKARQEDEDEELKIDRLLFSKLQDVDADSRKELRGSDPQIAMVADAEMCNSVVVLNIPEILSDLTKTEIETFLMMLDAARPTPEAFDSSNTSRSTDVALPISEEEAEAKSLCISISIDQITLSLKEDLYIEGLFGKREQFSCLAALDTFKAHILLGNSGLKHLRLLAHEPCLYAAYHKHTEIETWRFERDVEQRVALLKKNIRCYSNATVSPLLYRSHLFTPISQDTPSVLLDFIDPSSDSSNRLSEFVQKRVHLTLYHLTHRYDVDSKWMERMSSLIPQRESHSVDNSTEKPMDDESDRIPSMTRVFVSLADCNLDYTAPKYFEMTSRSIVRLGDFRFSSNIMQPAGPIQAFSLSLGDFSYHICNMGYSYQEETAKICRSSVLFKKAPVLRSRVGTVGYVSGSLAEALLRDMSFVNVLSLDSMDAIVAVKTSGGDEYSHTKNDPRVTVSLTFGLLSIHACKDSFVCFSGTLGELNAKLTALSAKDIEAMREESSSVPPKATEGSDLNGSANCQLNETNVIFPEESFTSFEATNGHGNSKPMDYMPVKEESEDFIPFLLDGYEWTTIDHDPLPEPKIPDGDEQIAIWYNNTLAISTQIDDPVDRTCGFPARIFHQHFPIQTNIDPLSDGDVGASKYAGEGANVTLKSRLLIHKLTVKLRFFDGYDWPDKLDADQKVAASRQNKTFIIEPEPESARLKRKEDYTEAIKIDGDLAENSHLATKARLLAGLLDNSDEESSTFHAPLPEERAANIERQEELRRLSRKNNLFFQISANGVTLRIDSFEKSDSHRLVSIMSLAIHDLFVAETASLSHPVKMLGEWINENAHPRDTRFGTLMFKMITWHPKNKLTAENEIENDDCEVIMQLLPMRCIIDQRAVQFIRAFLHSEDSGNDKSEKWSSDLHLVPPPRFRSFRVKPWKLKVDYIPKKLDVAALREGSFIELANISPIDGMVITLSEVRVGKVIGFGEAFSGLLSNWVKEICATQLHKFLSNARPFEPFTDVGQGIADLVVLPYEAFKNSEDVGRAMRSGFKCLAETVAFQALTTSSRLTQYAANKMASSVGGRRVQASNPLPSRPTHAPKGVGDVTGHAMQSLARGFQAANYKVVIVPYREFSRIGTTGAATSVIRGIPVLLVAPLTGATEALSYTLLGARNALRPDIRKEEEASRTGFNAYDG